MKHFFLGIFILLALSFIAPVHSAIEKSEDKKPSIDTASDDKESKAIREIEEEFGLCKDEALNEKLKRVSDKILSVLTKEEKVREFKFKVLDDEMVNAFALPDGHMYFFSGLVKITKSDDQLAAVVTHELTHVIKKHVTKINEEAIPWLIGGMLLSVIAEEPGVALAGEWMASATAQKYTRGAEEDADKGGLDLMIRAGYDPVGILEFFSLLVEEEKRNPILFQRYFFTHPFAHERLENMKVLLRERGYKIPDSIYRSYLESQTIVREKDNLFLADITFGDDVLFTIAGNDKESVEKRAEKIKKTIDEALKAGAKRFDFKIVKDNYRAWIQGKGRKIYEPTESDISNSGLSRDELLKKALTRIQRFLWEESVKRGI
jgi:hypothetical protein